MRNSRREFLGRSAAAGLSLAGAAVLPAAAQANAAASSLKFDDVYDVIVVGSGISGTMAALNAAKAGARTLMIEKLNRLGGTSRYSALDFACVGSDAQKKAGIKDTPEAMVADMSKVAAGLGDLDRALNIAANTGRAQRIMAEHGVKWKNLLKLGGHNTQRCLIAEGGGAGILRSLWASFERYPNLTVMSATKMDELIIENGAVVGIAARTGYLFDAQLPSDDRDNKSGKKVRLGARQGVIMATGGYARDKAFMKDEVPYLEHTANSCSEGATSGALKAMIKAGARPVQLGLYRFSFALPTEDFIWGVCIDAATGERYCAESLGRNAIALASVQVRGKGGKMPFIIYDEKALTKFHNIGRAAKSLAGLNGRNGTMYKFDTIDELAKHFEADLAKVRAAIEAYNKLVAAGADTAFKKDMERSGRKVEPISATGPFYGCPMSARWDYCPGGILTDTEARAMTLEDKKPLEGLWVVGEAAGGIHGAERLTACSMPDCSVTGMLAAESCVKAPKKNLA